VGIKLIMVELNFSRQLGAPAKLIALVLLITLCSARQVLAGGGYFSTGYGQIGKQTAGAVTAVSGDAYAGASNPGKLTAAGNQFEIGVEFLNPNRKVKRKGATGDASIYNFSSRSRNPLFVVPNFAYARQLEDDMAVGITVYANGGLNMEYTDTTGIPGSSSNPEACGTKPGSFLTGCGHTGFDSPIMAMRSYLARGFAWAGTAKSNRGCPWGLLMHQKFTCRKWIDTRAYLPKARSMYPQTIVSERQ